MCVIVFYLFLTFLGCLQKKHDVFVFSDIDTDWAVLFTVDMTEEIAFSDWSKRLECSSSTNAVSEETGTEPATNSWLPAYGFHQPSAALQQAFLQNKNIEFYSSGKLQFDKFVFLLNYPTYVCVIS